MVNLETSGQTQMNKIEPRGKIMEVPGESVVNTIVEKVSDGIIAKMNINEERRNREFTYQLKELEFYKSGYDKELRSLFDYWTELVWLAQFKDNGCLSQSEKEKYNKRYNELIHIDKIAKNKINTIKYGGKETGRVLALQSKLQQEKYKDQPTLVIECQGKKGQNNMEEIKKAKEYIKKVYKETYKEEPYWTE